MFTQLHQENILALVPLVFHCIERVICYIMCLKAYNSTAQKFYAVQYVKALWACRRYPLHKSLLTRLSDIAQVCMHTKILCMHTYFRDSSPCRSEN